MLNYLRALAARLRGVFGNHRADREFNDEIETRLRMLVERYVRQGMTAAEAAWAARRQFGNIALLQENRRDMRGIGFIETLVQDVRYGVLLRPLPYADAERLVWIGGWARERQRSWRNPCGFFGLPRTAPELFSPGSFTAAIPAITPELSHPCSPGGIDCLPPPKSAEQPRNIDVMTQLKRTS